MDQEYGEAFYVLGLISERAGQKERADEYFEKAGVRPFVRKTTPAKSKRQNAGAAVAAPLFRSSPSSSRKLITGGDRRLAEALREDALSACNSADILGR
jgi:hypothetical protein